MRSLLLCTALVLTTSAATGQQRSQFCADAGVATVPAQLLPVDEASRQPDFFTFRARLQATVAARDVEALVAAADPDIKLGFGGEEGHALLQEQFTREKAGPLWTEFARVLALGGAFRGADSFYAPYISANWPQGADSFECGVIVGQRVNVRREPKPDGAVIAVVSYALVRHMVAGIERAPDGWSAVELATGAKGFVLDKYLGGPTGLRAMFNRVRGVWRLTSLVAGD